MARRGGPSHETTRLVENRGRTSFRDLTLQQLDAGLSWKPGISKGIVTGRAPEDPAEWEADDNAVASAGPAGPRSMSLLARLLDNVPDVELAAELVIRLARAGTSGENRGVYIELLNLLARTSGPYFYNYVENAAGS